MKPTSVPCTRDEDPVMNVFRFLAPNRAEAFRLDLEHLTLVLVSTSIAIAIGVPLGV